ncbi:uncharacterized protein LOC128222976 [Mya arenaria]|uniref:uncharacterized protein LOC128222976 n=1 Tax=Mya arenaria TaxID=6604 RepID=UPI0022DFA96C|nr:uncharacterized protein LOC128222976 [Mya arenaria]
MQLLSLRLSQVLEDIGVSRYIRTRRSRTWLMEETIKGIRDEVEGNNETLYHFGSQTEGTTTIGMKSDIDTLYCHDSMPVILDRGEWKQEKRNLLVLKTEHSPPQHCWLQRLKPDLPLPETEKTGPSDMVDTEGRVLMTNTQVEICRVIRQTNESGEIMRHGPSKSWNDNEDNVQAYHCVPIQQATPWPLAQT